MKDEDELGRLNWNEERMGRAAAARDDPGMQPQTTPQEGTRQAQTLTQESTRPTVDASVGAEEEEEEDIFIGEGEDDMPIGHVGEAPDNDELM